MSCLFCFKTIQMSSKINSGTSSWFCGYLVCRRKPVFFHPHGVGDCKTLKTLISFIHSVGMCRHSAGGFSEPSPHPQCSCRLVGERRPSHTLEKKVGSGNLTLDQTMEGNSQTCTLEVWSVKTSWARKGRLGPASDNSKGREAFKGSILRGLSEISGRTHDVSGFFHLCFRVRTRRHPGCPHGAEGQRAHFLPQDTSSSCFCPASPNTSPTGCLPLLSRIRTPFAVIPGRRHGAR